jgi:Protein of unknown function (DUF1761)
MNLPSVNLLAVIVSAVVTMIIGALWYSPMLFANTWLRLINKNMEDVRGDATMYAGTFVAALLAAYVLAVVIRALGATTLINGILVGILTWLGLVAAPTFTYATFNGPNRQVWMLFAGYQLVAFVIMGAILGVWV